MHNANPQPRGSAQQVFVMGLPGAGKTTFLAALWHIVESNEVPGSLRLNRLEGDATYLNAIRNLWIEAKNLERTKTPDETNLLMVLDHPDGGSFELWIPDLAGESFETQWTDRVAGEQYCEYVRASGAGLLFLHPKIRQEDLIAEINALVPTATNGAAGPTGDASSESADDRDAWDPRFAPTQVQLVDLVQFAMALRKPNPLRLAIVVSAWDRVELGTDPAEWVKTQLPLLHQYLTVHSDTISTRCFGISAQGGDFGVQGEAEKLRATGTPSSRILVCDGQYQGSDIARPLTWLLQHSHNASANS